jgi:hypothetical protein
MQSHFLIAILLYTIIFMTPLWAMELNVLSDSGSQKEEELIDFNPIPELSFHGYLSLSEEQIDRSRFLIRLAQLAEQYELDVVASALQNFLDSKGLTISQLALLHAAVAWATRHLYVYPEDILLSPPNSSLRLDPRKVIIVLLQAAGSRQAACDLFGHKWQGHTPLDLDYGHYVVGQVFHAYKNKKIDDLQLKQLMQVYLNAKYWNADFKLEIKLLRLQCCGCCCIL